MAKTKLTFLTGNEGKRAEAQSILGDNIELSKYKIDLVEIQETDARAVVVAKLDEAKKIFDEDFFIEDTSLVIEAYGNGLPGPLIKFFIQDEDSLEKITAYTKFQQNNKAKAVCSIGLCVNGENQFFQGVIEGTISKAPIGENGFGWDKIFIPNGYSKTFAQMNTEEKNECSMRRLAFKKMLGFF